MIYNFYDVLIGSINIYIFKVDIEQPCPNFIVNTAESISPIAPQVVEGNMQLAKDTNNTKWIITEMWKLWWRKKFEQGRPPNESKS